MAEDRAETVEDAAREEVDYGLAPAFVEDIVAAIAAEEAERLAALIEPLHAADIADLLELLGATERRGLIALLPGAVSGEVLSELDEGIREEVIETLPADALAEAVRELDSDDVVDLIEDMEPPQQATILGALDRADRAVVEQSLAYPEYSAGRLMQREVVTAPEHWSVGEATDFLQGEDWLPDQFYHVILVNPRWQPVGYVTLGKLLSSSRDAPLAEIAEESFRTVSVYQEEGDVAYAFNQYHLISAPVVDDSGRLVGVITIDDAMSVLDEEHAEDYLRMAGVGEESALSDGVTETLRQRAPWLAVNLVTANISALVIAQFSNTISAVVALAALMPIVASMGGNAGTQSLAVAVRALATKDLTRTNAGRVIRREATVGLINGLGFALVMGTVGFVAYGSLLLGVVLALAMVINLVVAALAGVMVPLMLERFRLDPALASGTFVMTLTDVVGFFAFLALATVILL